MNGIEAEFSDRIVVVRLNVGEPDNARIQADYGVRGHPSAVILNEVGEVTQRFFGAETPEALRAALADVIPR